MMQQRASLSDDGGYRRRSAQTEPSNDSRKESGGDGIRPYVVLVDSFVSTRTDLVCKGGSAMLGGFVRAYSASSCLARLADIIVSNLACIIDG